MTNRVNPSRQYTSHILDTGRYIQHKPGTVNSNGAEGAILDSYSLHDGCVGEKMNGRMQADMHHIYIRAGCSNACLDGKRVGGDM